MASLRVFWNNRAVVVAGLALASCLENRPDPSVRMPGDAVTIDPLAAADGGVATAGTRAIVPPVAAEVAPPASPRLASLPAAAELRAKIGSYFEGAVARRVYVQLDKPLYKPGETIWIKSWDLRARSLDAPTGQMATYQLVSPKGAVVLQKLVQETGGTATNDLEIPADSAGGEYTLKVIASDGVQGERPVIVSTYEAPRLKMKLEFVRKAYGEGDEVTATFELKRSTGEALANHQSAAAIRVDGQDLPRATLTTGADGMGLVRFKLPPRIEAGDGLLTVLVEDGGVTESVSKRIPILVHRLQLATFPEGGKLIRSLPNRVYFEAKTPLGKPADVEGQIVDDLGNAVAAFQSYKDGLGRVDLTPATGRTYHAVITKPAGITEQYSLAVPVAAGCVLRGFDDLDGQLAALRVSVRCTETKKVIVTAVLRENTLDTAAVAVKAGEPAVVYLEAKDPALSRAQGIARVTIFDDTLEPLAERLVFRNRRARLGVKITPDKARYSPRAPVTLDVATTDPSGAPVAAELALSVVDDTVVSFADDKTGHLLSRLLLEPELPGTVEEPNAFLDLAEQKSALALDMLMGTRGWRTFAWQPVLHPTPPLSAMQALALPAAVPPPPVVRPMPVVPEVARRAAVAGARLAHAKKAAARVMEPLALAQGERNAPARNAAPGPAASAVAQPMGAVAFGRLARARHAEAAAAPPADQRMADEWAGAVATPLALVRVFPVPVYSGESVPARTDFRETIFWAPSVRTDATGHATVSFPASDAVTSFRVFSEGVGQGLAGRDESVIASSLPFSMSIKVPAEVSAGDVINLPLTLANEEARAADVSVDGSFGSLFRLEGARAKGGAIAGNARKSLFFPLEVTGDQGESEVRFSARAGGLEDDFVRQITVTRLGFPQTISRSGTASGTVTESFDLGDAIAGSGDVTLKLYPSPVASLVSGLDGMLREPSGCFEQTSSTNYPNVMVMDYLRSHDVADPALIDRSSKLLESGYRRLTGYESKSQGYEWFGGDPGHEALTAYGLLQFMDMKRVYGNVDDEMVRRTVRWLKGRRDGQGGYRRDPKALDSFGRASPEVTDAYITYALVKAGETDLRREIEKTTTLTQSRDAYLLALAANTLLRAPGHRDEGMAAAARLAGLQGADGAWKNAAESITRSGGDNLWIETTALSMLALLEEHGHEGELRKAVEWLQANRGGFGQWGATQATVLALQAMTAYDESNRRTPSSGTVSVRVNGQVAGEVAYEAGRREAISFSGLASKLRAGKNSIEIIQTGGTGLPYSMAVEFRSRKPATSADAKVDLQTMLEKTSVKMGETVRVDATVTNKTPNGLPMTLARVGFPGGLTFQTWQLKELREKGLIAFYETRPREVILYLRDMKPGEVKHIPLDLVAVVPGRYTGPASSAYLYYNDQAKAWTEALAVTIDP